MANDRAGAPAGFVSRSAEHITGDEKGEAQTYLNRLFRAFGHDGVREAGAAFEVRIPIVAFVAARADGGSLCRP